MTVQESPSSPTRNPQGPREQRRHTPKVKTSGLYQRAVGDAFAKLAPQTMVRNPVMFVVWVGTIITALLTLFPDLFGTVVGDDVRLFNGLITLILFFTLVFANFAEAVAEGRGKAQADALRSTKSETTARKLLPDGSVQEVGAIASRSSRGTSFRRMGKCWRGWPRWMNRPLRGSRLPC